MGWYLVLEEERVRWPTYITPLFKCEVRRQ